MNIYILTEITKRELDSNILLACIAANNNFEVMVSNSDTIKNLNNKKFLKEGVFHTKSLVHGQKKTKLHNEIKMNKMSITSLDEEAGLIYDDLTFFCESRFSNEALSKIDKVFCWGKHDFEVLKSMYPTFKEKFVLSGSPRIDILKNNLKPYWQGNKNEKKSILISSNFNLVNGFLKTSKIIEEIKKQGFFERSQKYKKELDTIIPESLKKFDEFKNMIKQLASSFPEENFIIRPHPMEKIDTWENFFSENKNIQVNNEGNINSQLQNCKLLIHNSCSTAFHAFMYKIPTLSYEPFESKSQYGKPANKISDSIQDINSLKNKVRKILTEDFKNLNKEIKNEIFNYKIFISSISLSSELIVETWKKILDSHKIEKNNWKQIKFELKKIQIKEKLIQLLVKIFKPYKKTYLDRKFEKISEKNISDKVQKICSLLKYENIFCEKLSDKSFLIRKFK
jgi:surface carbohydrate biosynthesis protein